MSGAKTEADTITKLLVRRLHESGNRKVAMRSKEFGIWRTYTWKDSYDNVKYIALALKEIAANAGKIGNLNISPELLQMLMEKRE